MGHNDKKLVLSTSSINREKNSCTDQVVRLVLSKFRSRPSLLFFSLPQTIHSSLLMNSEEALLLTMALDSLGPYHSKIPMLHLYLFS